MITPIFQDQQCFLDKIYQEPEELSHRLVYADWLNEQDVCPDPGRAEFIRVQYRIAQGFTNGDYCTHLHKDPCECFACTTLRHQSVLLAQYAGQWRSGPVCASCDGQRWVASRVRGIRDRCPDCWDTGDAGGLKRTFTYDLDMTVGGTVSPVRLTFRVGFPHRVTVPAMADLVQTERYCAVCVASNWPSDGLLDRHAYCARCDATRSNQSVRLLTRPTPWLTVIAKHWPTILEVLSLDRTPINVDIMWMWSNDAGSPYSLTPEIWTELEGYIEDNERQRYYSSRKLAITAFTRGIMKWARSKTKEKPHPKE